MVGAKEGLEEKADRAMNYEAMGYKDLKDELARRKITVPAEHRSVEGMKGLLRLDDDAKAPKGESEDPGELTEVGAKLATLVPQPSAEQLRVIGEIGENRNRVEEALRVRNLPADYVYGWASLNNGGEDLGRWTSLGWIMCPAEMVTSDPQNTSKIFVSGYDLHMGSYVRKNDTVLVIAHRRIVETREAATTRSWNRKVESMYGEGGELRKDSYRSQESGSTFRRTAQRTPEDLVAGGDS